MLLKRGLLRDSVLFCVYRDIFLYEQFANLLKKTCTGILTNLVEYFRIRLNDDSGGIFSDIISKIWVQSL